MTTETCTVLLVDGPKAGTLLTVRAGSRSIRLPLMAAPNSMFQLGSPHPVRPSFDDVTYDLTNPEWVKYMPSAVADGVQQLGFSGGVPQQAYFRLLIDGQEWHYEQTNIIEHFTSKLVNDATTGAIEGSSGPGKLVGEPIVTVVDIDRTDLFSSTEHWHLIRLMGQNMIELTGRCLIQPVPA